MDIVDIILRSDAPKNVKIIRLVAVSQLYYRHPLGEKAWKMVATLTDTSTMLAISYLVGFCSAPEEDKWDKLLRKEIVQ